VGGPRVREHRLPHQRRAFHGGPLPQPIVSDLDLDRGRFSLVISLSLFLYGAFVPLVGGRVGAGRQSALLISAAEPRPVAGVG
jgi:hypothetical protein